MLLAVELRCHLVLRLAFLALLASEAGIAGDALSSEGSWLRDPTFDCFIRIHDYFFLHYLLSWLPIPLVTTAKSADIIEAPTLEWISKHSIAAFKVFIRCFIAA